MAEQKTKTPVKPIGVPTGRTDMEPAGVLVSIFKERVNYVYHMEADHAQSLDLLRKNGLRMLTCQEVLLLTVRSPPLLKELRGSRFYLADGNLQADEFSGIDDQGNLRTPLAWDPADRRVWLIPGSGIMMLEVRTDDKALFNRFDLYGDFPPNITVNAIIGVKDAVSFSELRGAKR